MKSRFLSPRVLLTVALILGVVVLLAAVVLWMAAPNAPGQSWRPRTEQEWIVADIASTIARISAFGTVSVAPSQWAAETRPAEKGELARFEVTSVSPRLRATVFVRSHIWDPTAYVPLALAVSQGLRREQAHEDAEDTIAKLTDLSAAVLEDVNEHVSRELRRRPSDPDLHEQAALLAVALGIREEAGPFQDVRPALNRGVAHLALARALRGDRTLAPLAGRLAECGVSVLAGRQADARDQLAALQGQALSQPARQWVRALQAFNANDWRVFKGATALCRLEMRAHLRALCVRVGTAAATEEADRLNAGQQVDTAWLIMDGSFSVGEGNRFAQSTLSQTLAETTDIARRFGVEVTDAAGISQALARVSDDRAAPGAARPAVRIEEHRVLDWPLMARFYERHLVHAIGGVAQWFDNVGLADERREFDGQTDFSFGALPLYCVLPLIHPSADPVRIPAATRSLTQLVRSQPERLTATAWGWATYDRIKGTLAEAASLWHGWFAPRNPAGSVLFDVYRRLRGPCACENPPAAIVTDARRIAPLRVVVANIEAEQRYGKQPQFADLKSEYGELAEFDVTAMERLAWSAVDRPADFMKLYASVCDLVPNRYANLGSYLATRDLDDDAARAFREMMARADPVVSSNYADWLINYEADHGRIKEAIGLADQAAEAYSAGGLQAKANLLERLGRYGEAEGLHRAVADRYQSEWGLMAFHFRRSQHDPSGKHAAEGARLLALLGKGYMQPINVERIVRGGQPDSGVLIVEAGPKLAGAGLKDGDIVVAVNGIRVADWQQYDNAARLSDDPRVTFLAWRGDRYIEASGSFKHHYMPARVDSYRRRYQ